MRQFDIHSFTGASSFEAALFNCEEYHNTLIRDLRNASLILSRLFNFRAEIFFNFRGIYE